MCILFVESSKNYARRFFAQIYASLILIALLRENFSSRIRSGISAKQLKLRDSYVFILQYRNLSSAIMRMVVNEFIFCTTCGDLQMERPDEQLI